jgi:hypothetical protein
MNELWCRDWTLCLQEILSILGLTLQMLAQATTEGVREEVLASHQGQAIRKLKSSVADPRYFGADPDPWILTSDYLIRIRLQIFRQ